MSRRDPLFPLGYDRVEEIISPRNQHVDAEVVVGAANDLYEALRPFADYLRREACIYGFNDRDLAPLRRAMRRHGV